MMQGLRKHLLEELEQTFPGEVETYREIRAASAAVSYIYSVSLFHTLKQSCQIDAGVKGETK